MSITKEVFVMKGNIKSFICGMLVMGVISSAAAIAADNWQNINVLPNTIKVVVDGKEVQADNFLYNDTTYLPIRAVSEALKMDVQYDNATSTATISEKKEDDNVGTVTSKYTPQVDEKTLYNDFRNQDDVWYCRIDYIDNNLDYDSGYKASWDEETQSLIISKSDTIIYKTKAIHLKNDDVGYFIPYDQFVEEIEPLLK